MCWLLSLELPWDACQSLAHSTFLWNVGCLLWQPLFPDFTGVIEWAEEAWLAARTTDWLTDWLPGTLMYHQQFIKITITSRVKDNISGRCLSMLFIIVRFCFALFFFLVIFFFLVLFFYFRKHSKITAGQKAASSFHLASFQLLSPRLYHPGRCTFCVLPILCILLQCRLLQSVVTITSTSTSSTTSIAFLLAAISSELCLGH